MITNLFLSSALLFQLNSHPLNELSLLYKYFLTPCPVNEPKPQSDFTMHLETFNFKAYEKKLRDSSFAIKKLQTIRFQMKTYPIFQIDKPLLKGKKLLIFAATHGNEFVSALVIPELLNEMKNNPSKYSKWHIRIITPINPVGLVHQSRYNETGCDINRDFNLTKTTGAQIQAKAIQEFQPDIIISLHEGPQNGYFMVAESNTPPELEKQILVNLNKHNIPLANKSFLGLPLKNKGLWHKEGLVYHLQTIGGVYSLGRYANDRKKVMITTESDWKVKSINDRILPHLITIDAIIAHPELLK